MFQATSGVAVTSPVPQTEEHEQTMSLSDIKNVTVPMGEQLENVNIIIMYILLYISKAIDLSKDARFSKFI